MKKPKALPKDLPAKIAKAIAIGTAVKLQADEKAAADVRLAEFRKAREKTAARARTEAWFHDELPKLIERLTSEGKRSLEISEARAEVAQAYGMTVRRTGQNIYENAELVGSTVELYLEW